MDSGENNSLEYDGENKIIIIIISKLLRNERIQGVISPHLVSETREDWEKEKKQNNTLGEDQTPEIRDEYCHCRRLQKENQRPLIGDLLLLSFVDIT